MKTNIVMIRTLNGDPIRQRTSDGYFNVTDLISVGNKLRAMNGKPLFDLSQYLSVESNKIFIKTLQDIRKEPVIETRRGKNGGTWASVPLFMDIAFKIDPKFKAFIYCWAGDQLIPSRTSSGDSFKLMSKAIKDILPPDTTGDVMQKIMIKISNKIKHLLNVDDWQSSSIQQLQMRDLIHNNIAILADVVTDKSTLVEVAYKKALAIYKNKMTPLIP